MTDEWTDAQTRQYNAPLLSYVGLITKRILHYKFALRYLTVL